LDELDRDHEASEQAEMSASRRKIQLQETVKAEEIDEEKWTMLKGRSIVSACRFMKDKKKIKDKSLLRAERRSCNSNFRLIQVYLRASTECQSLDCDD